MRKVFLMTTEHIKTRRKIQDIAEVKTFEELIDGCMLDDETKELLRLHYIHGKDFRYIGDKLGYSEDTIKRKHQKALKKLSHIIL